MSRKDGLLGFHLLAKPTGAICNLNCKYCFFLSKKDLYPGSTFRMSDALLESYIRQYIEAQKFPLATLAWQGGEPTLMGLNFFTKAMEMVRRYRRPGMVIHNTIQTNGTLINDEWCRLFKENNFLVGLSLDGPREIHDSYRVDKSGKPTFDRVLRAAKLLRRHKVDFNILTAIHAANGDQPLEVYWFLRDKVGAEFLQFIPIVERDETGMVTEWSVRPAQYGRFLISIFDEWIRRDVGKVFVQIFDASLAAWTGAFQSICIFSETCGTALALEHNGDLYSCDHFVDKEHLLGNIERESMGELATSEKQRRFGQDKLDSLPKYCLKCEVLFACNGECPKNRFMKTPDGQPGLNYLCAGYRDFFRHIDGSMRFMANEIRQGREPANIMEYTAYTTTEYQGLSLILAGTTPARAAAALSTRSAMGGWFQKNRGCFPQ
jgi:uncharacterized protein